MGSVLTPQAYTHRAGSTVTTSLFDSHSKGSGRYHMANPNPQQIHTARFKGVREVGYK